MAGTFGEGIFSAYRQDGVVHLQASGSKPTPQTKVTIEQLPFFIFPPQFGLMFETQGITNPLVVPFDIERALPNYPPDVKFVFVVDKNGVHTIDIAERPSSGSRNIVPSDPASASFVVYQQIGTDRYMIAKADAIVPAIYIRVFGPDTYANCQAYVAAHTVTPAPSLDIVADSLEAWIDRQPGTNPGPKFFVTVDAIVEVDWGVELVSAEPQGFNPLVKLLRFDVKLPTGPVHSNALIRKSFRYEEVPTGLIYTDVTIENGNNGISKKVKLIE